jgi:hypothetical protein
MPSPSIGRSRDVECTARVPERPERGQEDSNNSAEPGTPDFACLREDAATLMKELSAFGGQTAALARI